MALHWYVVHVYSGYEKKVAQAIEEQAKQIGMEDQIDQVLVPTEEVIEMRRGAKVNSERKFAGGLQSCVACKSNVHVACGLHILRCMTKNNGICHLAPGLIIMLRAQVLRPARAAVRVRPLEPVGCALLLGAHCKTRLQYRCRSRRIRHFFHEFEQIFL